MELCGIPLSDLDYLTNMLRVTGKRGKYCEVPLPLDLVDLIYIQSERQDTSKGKSLRLAQSTCRQACTRTLSTRS